MACQTLDVLAISLPPEKYLSALLPQVQPALEQEPGNPGRKKAAYNALAVSAEGCSEHIRSKYLVTFLQVIGKGIRDGHPVVRNAALYALGQYSEYLQPDISKFAGEILPVLFEFLDSHCAAAGAKDPPGLDRIFYALEIFGENLEDKLVPFLPELMRRLLHLLGEGFSVHTK